jgi:hypothetical protein
VAREENIGIRFKILSDFLILAMMLCVAGVWSIYELTAMGNSIKGLLDEDYKAISAARVMTEALEREDSALLLLLSGNRKEGREFLKASETSFSEALGTAKNKVTIPYVLWGVSSPLPMPGLRAYRALQPPDRLFLPISRRSRLGFSSWLFKEDSVISGNRSSFVTICPPLSSAGL